MKKNELLGALKKLVLFVVFLGGVHLLLLDYVLPKIYFQFELIYAYLFLVLLSVLGLMGMVLIKKNDDTMIGNGFLAYTTLKMFASVGFLFPWLRNQDEFTMPFIFQFFAIFFPLLILETIIIVKLTNSVVREKVETDQNQLKK
jgi:hypothetical protein